MTIRIVCPGCKAPYQVMESLLGKIVKCRHCAQSIDVAAAQVGPTPAAPAADAPPKPAPPPVPAQKDVAAKPPPVLALAQLTPPPDEELATVVAVESPKPSRRRRVEVDDEDDEPAPRKPAKRRRPTGHLSPMKILAVTFAIVVMLGGASLLGFWILASYFPSTVPSYQQAQNPGGIPPGYEDGSLTERQDSLAAYWLTPEEPPVHTLEFTEPLGLDPGVSAQGPARNTTGQLAPDVLKRIKEASVYVGVKSSHGEGSGSGFFAAEPGIVITNAHVVGMLVRNSPEPTSVKVVRNKGEKNEITLTAKVVAVDHDADLALLSVPKEGLPEPLVVKSAQNLLETQPVYVAGFPLGEVPGKSISINKYELSSLKKEKGVLDKLQIQGGMLPGNSGGPVLDADGDVIGVCVSILRNTNMNFAIPGDKVRHFMNGRLTGLSLEPPAEVDGHLQVPVAMALVNPLGRVRNASLSYWVGKPAAARPGSWTQPETQPGDAEHQTLTLVIKQQAARGELVLPPLPEGQAYWLQPSLVVGTGPRVWLSAQVYQPPPPVERKPALLSLKPDGNRPLVLERFSSLQFADPNGKDHRALVAFEARLTDTVQGRQGNELPVSRQFASLKEGVILDGKEHMTRRLQNLGPNVQNLAINLAVDAAGKTHNHDFDTNKINSSSGGQRRQEMYIFGKEMDKLLQTLEVPLPGKVVQPGATWKDTRNLLFDPTWRLLDVLPPQMFAGLESDTLEVTYTYTGLRTVQGAEHAVIHLDGRVVREQKSDGADTAGRLSGTAVVDVATGQIVEEEVTSQASAEFVILSSTAARAQGVVVARLRRE